jgi:16S rRNA (cytosine1402-N4)-methyltransferase
MNGAVQHAPSHTPVLIEEVLAALEPSDGDVIIDGTFGGGGYSRALLDAADCRVFGIDRDPDAQARARALQSEYPGRFEAVDGRFSAMADLMRDHDVEAADGVVLDLGLSSFQLDDASRGFSIQHDGPLDMRMSGEGLSAADFINSADEFTLADTIWRYGEERKSRAIARAIVAARDEAPIEGTEALANIVAGAVAGGGRQRIHPATRTFQALRIYLNEELGPSGELEAGLIAAENILAVDGRLAVVSFHSLEDRVVKTFITTRAGDAAQGSRHLPPTRDGPTPTFKAKFRGAHKPTTRENAANPRARSARLRAAVRTAAPPWPKRAAA